jgi:hypothetical protein
LVDAIKQVMGSFVTFTFSTKFLCGVNQILTVIAVIQIPNLRQAFMSKSRNYYVAKIIGENYPSSVNIAKKFGFEKLTGFLNHKPGLI